MFPQEINTKVEFGERDILALLTSLQYYDAFLLIDSECRRKQCQQCFFLLLILFRSVKGLLYLTVEEARIHHVSSLLHLCKLPVLNLKYVYFSTEI